MNTMLLELMEAHFGAFSHIEVVIDDKEIIQSAEGREMGGKPYDFIPLDVELLVGLSIDEAIEKLNASHKERYQDEFRSPYWVMNF